MEIIIVLSIVLILGVVLLITRQNKIELSNVSKNFETSMRRIRGYVRPKESERVLKAYGTASSIRKWVIIEKEKY